MARKRTPSKRHSTSNKKTKRQARKKPLGGRGSRRRGLTVRRQDQRSRVFDALNLYRQGKAKSVSAAARTAGTTPNAMWEWVPRAISKDPRSGRLHIKPTDPYSASVQILTDAGAVTASARGSRQRELAGRHRATVMRVLAGKEPATALDEYRGKKIGGHALISDYTRLTTLAQAGVLGQLDALYVSPDGGR
jgi:hypothetical protein